MIMLTPFETEALLLSLKVGGIATLGALIPAILISYLLARGRFPLKWLLDGIVHAPLVVPPVVIGYLLLIGLGPRGPIGAPLKDWFVISIAFTWQGAAMAAGVMAFPLMVRAIRLSLEQVDMRLEQAATTLGASRLDVFFSITLPMIAPGIVVSVILGFARALGEFGATITFVANIPGETRTMPLALYTLAQTPGAEAQAGRLALLSVIVALVALIASEAIARKTRRAIGLQGEHAP